eukprot:204449_1
MAALDCIDELIQCFSTSYAHITQHLSHIKEMDFSQSCECQINSDACCIVVDRIINGLKYYASLDTTTYNDKLVEFSTLYLSLLNDYTHIITHHNNDVDTIQNVLNAKCDITTCSLLIRNFANESSTDNYDPEFIFYRNLFDAMHCYVYHSYDIGLRVNRDHIITENVDDEYDVQFANICKIIDEKTQLLSNLKGFEQTRFTNNKFNLDVDVSSSIDKHQNKETTALDGLFEYMKHYGISDNEIITLYDMILSEEYDSDAISSDVVDYNSNIAIKYSQIHGTGELKYDSSINEQPPICMCSKRLFKFTIANCYPVKSVICDLCGVLMETVTEYVYHCVAKNEMHPRGYDICLICADNISREQNGRRSMDIFNVIQQYQEYTKISQCSFHIGYRFYYWDYYKNNKSILDKQTIGNKYDHSGYKPHELYIEAKYQSIKQEILNNTICVLSIHQFTTSLTKALKYVHAEAAKQCKCRVTIFQNVYKIYGINNNTPISVNNLLSVILYCDWTELCCKFSKTFRKNSIYQPISSIINSNSEYANWSRVLRETVELYGQTGDDYVWDNDGHKVYAARGPFYTGMTFVMAMPEFNIRLCSPTSTSMKIEVATRFGGDKGMILQLNNIGYELSTKLHSFNCAWLSNYSGEDERLFFGGAYRIQIQTIRNISTAQNFRIYLKPLYYFNCLISGTTMFVSLNGDDCYDWLVTVTGDDKTILENLIWHRLKIYQNAYCKYINDTFEAFVNQQTQIVINLHQINMYYHCLRDLI